MKLTPITFASVLIFTCGSIVAEEKDQQHVSPIPVADFENLHATLNPQPGESPWREIAWITNITEARQRAAEENKPLVIFTAADGSPLGRT